MVRRLAYLFHLNPYTMWKEQTPRQVYELFKTYQELHKDIDKPKNTSDGKVYSNSGGVYNTVGRPKIPEWLKSKIPDGATIYNADVVTQEQMMSD